MSTTYMQLDLPVVGIGGTIGPTWATMLNTALSLIDEHDHSTNKGQSIPISALNINAALSFNEFDATDLRTTSYVNHSASLADTSCVYVSGGNLYYNNSSGTAIQLTSGSGINLTSIGTIGGDYSISTASEYYTTLTTTFTFTQSTGITANIQCGPIYITENVTSGKYIKLQTPTGLGSNYTYTLPTVPASTLPLFSNSSGIMSFMTITNDHISASAAIAYSKLNLTGLIVNADIKSSAAIAYSKLSLTNSIVTGDLTANCVTRAKQSVPVIYSSDPIITETVSGATYTTVSTIEDFPFTGRPVQIYFTGNGSNSSYLYMGNTDPGACRILINGNAYNVQIISGASPDSPLIYYVKMPISAFACVVDSITGTYDIEFQIKATSGTTVYAGYFTLNAMEL